MIVDTQKIESLAGRTPPSQNEAAAILQKAGECRGLSIEEAAALLSIRDPQSLHMLYGKAGEVKGRVFGKRVVLFAPLYLSNYCTNGCLYCGFRSSNRGVARNALKIEDVIREARALESMGFKRVLLVAGEDPRWGLDYIISSVKAIYENTGMRIVHVNAPPMDTGQFKELKASGVGVYQSFQETYHRPTYGRMHPSGMKKDYDYRIEVMDRAISAGFGDVGIGSLLGLYDFKFDSLSAIAHSQHLYEKFGAHAHTISVPRLRPAESFDPKDVPYPVTDDDIRKVVAVYRLTVPSAGVVISTRESAGLRSILIREGASQLSAASRTSPGGYTNGESLEQFSTNDHRTLAEVIASIAGDGFLPSLCTSCYRVGRVGHEFTEKTMAGDMEKLCQANAILTLKEYLSDHAGTDKEAVKKILEASLDDIKDPSMKKAVLEKLKELEEGKRDIFF